VNEREALRYMGVTGRANGEVLALLHSCIEESARVFTPRVCFREVLLRREGDLLDLGFARVRSTSLSKALCGCERVVLFAATVGLGIDRLIAAYSRVSPARALCLQAVGAERIEALCDAVCKNLQEEYAKRGMALRPRFSPGYGDLPLELQTDLFKVLDCQHFIGLTLNDSMLMSPSKSVTAIVGLREREMI
jgi:hypothetical protein